MPVSREHVYNDDPELIMLPLSVEEASVLEQDPGMLRKRDLPHLLRRVLATTVQVRETRRNYDDELRRRTEARPRPGLSANLSPEQAAKYLSREQLTRLFDQFSQERLAALATIQERAAADHHRLVATIDEVVAMLVATLDDPELPGPARDRVRELVDDLQRTRDNPIAPGDAHQDLR